MPRGYSYNEQNEWMGNTDGNDQTSSDDVIRTEQGWVKIHPNGTREVLVSMVGADSRTHIAEFIMSVGNPATGDYMSGATLTFQVAFNDTVFVANSPRLVLDVGGVTKYADFASASGSDVFFDFAVDTDLGDVTVAMLEVDMNGGSIQDGTQTDANNDFPADYAQPVDVVVVEVS